MRRKIIYSIDLSMIMHNVITYYSEMLNFRGSIDEQSTYGTPLQFMAGDMGYYKILVTDVLFKMYPNLSIKNIHFVYNQCDTLHFIDKESENIIYNFYGQLDTDMYSGQVYNNNWISYGIDTKKIQNLIWIKANNSPQYDISKYEDVIDESNILDNLNLQMLPIPDDIVIALSTWAVLPTHWPLIDSLIENTGVYFNEIIKIEDYQFERDSGIEMESVANLQDNLF